MAWVGDHPSQQYKHYIGNPQLKAENVVVQFTKDQIDEYIKCKNDYIYFIKNYIKIVNVDRGLIDFEMYDFQEEMAHVVHKNRFSIMKLPRQVGKTTTIGSYLLWTALFYKDQNLAILANKGETAKEIILRIQKSYENLPLWLQQGVREWNKHSMVLENGSRILATSTGGSAGRGQSFNIVMLDEFAFVPRNIAEDFITSIYPVISSGTKTKIIMVSTPNGMNLFYKYWSDAVNKRNLYIPFEAHWSQVPGRDEKWKQETILNTSEEQFEQEYECLFRGGSNTLISPVKLGEMVWKEPIKKYSTADGNYIRCYELPEVNKSYTCVVDTSRGMGYDYSAFTIIDVSQSPYKVVATFKSNTTSYLLYPDIIVSACKLFNNAHILVETNDLGQQIVDTIHLELEYEYLFSTFTQGRGGQKLASGFGKKNTKFGVSTTESLKRVGCSNLKHLVESDSLIIEDYDIIEELSTFTKNKKNNYNAEDGTHDDLVMTLVLFGWLSKENLFKELTNIDLRKKLYSENIKKIENEILPPSPIITNDEEESFTCSNGDRWIVVDNNEDDDWSLW
jgi:hypothetical protein